LSQWLQRFAVQFEYPVYFTRGAFEPDSTILRDAISYREPSKRHRVCVVIDSGVAEAWGVYGLRRYFESHSAELELVAPPKIIPGGEHCKNDASLLDGLHQWLEQLRMDRQSVVLVVGGGAVQDLVGFAAATFHRGIRTVRLPTTVLSQNDSGVGVKNGVNAFNKKNFLGSFWPPFAVLNDFDFLRTLPKRDRLAGMAEAVKVALIRDAEFFGWLEANAAALASFEDGPLAELIERCAKHHLDHIAHSGDPFELGSARPLDFGHWAAHKLESLTDYSVRHGEAVAIGLALDARYSVEAGWLDGNASERVVRLLSALGFELWHPELEHRQADGTRVVLGGLEEFREHLGGQLSVPLLRQIGKSDNASEIDPLRMERALAWLRAREDRPLYASPATPALARAAGDSSS
jgi:3-dehydroquinate synthase